MILVNYGERLYKELMEELDGINFNEKELMGRLEKSILATVKYLRWLKDFVKSNPPGGQAEEIAFFKEVKPKFKAQLIFYRQVLNIETRRTIGDTQAISNYYLGELDVLTHFFDSNQSFYAYVRTGATYLDEQYYVRGRYDPMLDPDENSVDADETFCTGHDRKLAQVLASELLLTYLERRIAGVNNREGDDIEAILEDSYYIWTQTKSALVELGYGLFLTHAFNQGNATLNGLMHYLEKVFHVDLGNFYDTFKTIRRRDQRTLYIDQLKQALIDKMEDMLK
jgi:hypothetical protein